ncbi:MAG: histidinol-phosphate transaminase [Acidimicrobiales bacterium]|nr:histidinol-phosphate transaminase [Acidimicrobiales bacterium]
MSKFVRPASREAVAAMESYHAPQLDVAVRLNTNESPFAPPQAFREAMGSVVTGLQWHRYPDRQAADLRTALASAHGVSPEEVFVANGSNEVLQSLYLAYGGPGRNAMVFEPTFAMYAQIAHITGTGVLRGARDSEHRLVPNDVLKIVEEQKPELIFLCSPNNPTGTMDPAEMVAGLVDLAATYGGMVVVDEAYGQFAKTSAADLLAENLPVVVSRTFSKTWALAGIRLGYLVAPTWCVNDLEKVVLPYHLDVFKQAVGVIALQYEREMEERVAELVAERGRVAAALGGLAVTAWPSEANFILFRPEARPGAAVWQALLDRSVLVRDFTTMAGTEGCLRVTIGTVSENNRFLEALDEALREEPDESALEGV